MDAVVNKQLECLLASDQGKDNLAVRPETNIGISVYLKLSSLVPSTAAINSSLGKECYLRG